MGRRVVVMRRIPDAALELLREEADDVWVSPHDRPLSTAELRHMIDTGRAHAADYRRYTKAAAGGLL